MTSEALQNPYFVRLYCKNIDKTHSLTEPNDKIQFHGNYFFKKKGGEPLWKRGGGTDPLSPPPLNPPLGCVILTKGSEMNILDNIMTKHPGTNWHVKFRIKWSEYCSSHGVLMETSSKFLIPWSPRSSNLYMYMYIDYTIWIPYHADWIGI